MPNTRVPAAGEAMPAASIEANVEVENAYRKVRRLARELSDALAECDDRFDYSYAEVHARTQEGEQPVYLSCMTAEERLQYHARCFAQTAKEIDPSATEYWMGRGTDDNPQRFMLVVAAKQGEGQ